MPGVYTFKPIEANLTHDTSMITKMDPYCCFEIGKTKLQTRVCRKGGKHPHWSDTFAVHLPEESSAKVQLHVLDKEWIVHDEDIGDLELDLKEVQDKGQVCKWYPLSYEKKCAGEILMEVRYDYLRLGKKALFQNDISKKEKETMEDVMEAMQQWTKLVDLNLPIDNTPTKNVKEKMVMISLERLKDKEFNCAKEELKMELDKWANPQYFYLKTAGGRHLLSKGKEKALYLCNATDCDFQLYFIKEAHQDFFLLDDQKSVNVHNHALVFKNPRGKLFTSAMEETIQQLMGKLTMKVLTTHINRLYGTNFLFRQVENKASDLYRLTFGTPSNDASRLMKKLIQLEREGDGVTKHEPDRFLYVSPRMKALFSQYNDIIFVDTILSKNRFNMPIVNIIGVDNEGHNILFGFALVNNCKQETFDWVFRNFSLIMGKDPEVIFSNQDEALVKSLIKTFPEASHRLCGWHISRNLAAKFRYLDKSADDKDREMYKMIIGLPFETRMNSLEAHVAEIEEYPNINNIDDLQTLLKHKQKYAVCYIKYSFCAGINTTSRSEVIHAQLSHYINSKSSLQELFYAFRGLERVKAERFEGELPKSLPETIPDPYLDWLSQIYSSYAIKKFAPLLELHNSFKVKKLRGGKMWQVRFRFESTPNKLDLDTDTYYVTLEDKKLSCDCQLNTFQGIPCVHEVAACVSEGGDPELLKFSAKWAKSNTVENLPEDAELPTVIEDYDEDEVLKELEETEKLMKTLPNKKTGSKKTKRSAREDREGERFDRSQGEIKRLKQNDQASVTIDISDSAFSVGSQEELT